MARRCADRDRDLARHVGQVGRRQALIRELAQRLGVGSAGRSRYHLRMATPARKVLEEALALTPEQRLDLAAELLASVDGEPPETWEAAWRAELDDRMKEVETGAVRPVPWAEARARLRARLADG